MKGVSCGYMRPSTKCWEIHSTQVLLITNCGGFCGGDEGVERGLGACFAG